MARLLETIRIFDVDRMKGMSVAMFTPIFVDAKTLGDELDTLLADPETGLMAGLVRFLVIERLNGLMAVTPRPEYLKQIRDWVERLDIESGGSGRRLFVYRVQNGKAAELAEVLNQLFEDEEETDGLPRPRLAPGLAPVTARSTPAEGEETAPPPAAAATGEGLALPTASKVRIIADEPNNALLVLASAQEYRQVLDAMKQLDVVPMQVLIDVTIAEVTLSDNLEYGLEWTFDNYIKTNRGNFTGTGLLDLGAGGLSPQTGFSYALTGATGVRAVLNMLAEEGNLSVLSSPSLLVLNNQEASIQVGDQVPIATQQRQDTTNPDAPIINNVEYRDTGVLLNVTPRVNPGGLVIMEVSQEVSQVSESTTLGPTISNRSVKSNVAVQSGDTIVLGGLIQDQRDRSEAGIPGLHKAPLIGPLFGTKGDNQRRTELLVLITPRAIADRNTALRVTDEFRRKLNSLIPIETEDSAVEKASEKVNP
jgi:general secretion pathway protein D